MDLSVPKAAIVEIMGHITIVGHVSEVNQFGTTMLRIDVAETENAPAFTRFYNGSSVFSLTYVSDDVLDLVIKNLRVAPVSVYELTSHIHIQAAKLLKENFLHFNPGKSDTADEVKDERFF